MEECIHLTTQPTQLIASYPYLFVLVKNYLYVYNLPSLTRIQKIPLEGHFHIVPYDDAFLLYSVHNIYRLGLLSAHDQIEMLLSLDPPMFQQALVVASNHNLDKEIVQKLHVRYGYYLFGFVSIVILILIITTSEISIVLTYSLLCAENYHWWWMSFIAPASSGVYAFGFSLYYLIVAFNISNVLVLVEAVGYLLILSTIFSLFTGCVGFLASFVFVSALFGSVKVD